MLILKTYAEMKELAYVAAGRYFTLNSLKSCIRIVKKMSNLYCISYLWSSLALPEAIRLGILVLRCL
jgi:hypothetical protein